MNWKQDDNQLIVLILVETINNMAVTPQKRLAQFFILHRRGLNDSLSQKWRYRNMSTITGMHVANTRREKPVITHMMLACSRSKGDTVSARKEHINWKE